ncbi:inter-alpha-trypsin inhibitor heavy chain H4 isoform X1 [Cryptotermes secundus]|nr:inter-alpha-trypsin inhibitor heavy chain H4 isoform X1 [Cryptotermes secundus]
MRMLTMQLLCALLLCYQSVVTLTAATTENGGDVGHHNSTVPKPIILRLYMNTDIRFRYARTAVTSRVSNAANISQEVAFSVVLPDAAFVSGFHMVADGVQYDAYVREREAARQEYTQALRRGRTAGHVALSTRDSQRFAVSVNVEPHKKIDFRLTYEELLGRRLGTYRHVLNLDPGQIVQDLRVTTRISESSNITSLRVPALRTSNEILDDPSEASNPLVIIERPSPESAVVKFWPTEQQQRDLAAEGLQGQLVVEYEVDRTSRPGEVLVSDGYFVHFFAPEHLPPLRKHVIFVLDVSGSMSGRKITQLKEAMSTILSDLNQGDLFSIVPFSSTVQVWDYNATESELRNGRRRLGQIRWGDYGEEEEEQAETLVPTVIATATSDNIEKAKEFVNDLSAIGATNINAALQKALQISRLSTEENSVQKPEPIVIFLTDGQANIHPSDPVSIMSNVRQANTGNSSIFSLALGRHADFTFLQKLSLRNTGFARKIYEASDTALQLRDFYRQVASPLLANVTFTYQPDQVARSTLTRTKFRRIFSGSEVVVAGRQSSEDFTSEVKGQSLSGNSQYSFTPTALPPADTNANASSMERLWAYLTIQQLLEKQDAGTDDVNDYYCCDEADDDGDRNNTDALTLALRYSFVTRLTSLVVVKPNENASSVNTEDASEATAPTAHALPDGIRRQTPYSASALQPRYSFVPPPGGSGRQTHYRPDPMLINHSHVISPGLSTANTLATLSDITWLSPNDTVVSLPTGVNRTVEVLLLATANEINVAYAACTTPGGESGHCRHLKYCVLHLFTNSREQFLEYFCRIDSFLGVCCPDSVRAPENGR